MKMDLRIRPTLAKDAEPVGNLAHQFADYLRSLGDTTDFNLTAERFLQDGFGPRPAFAGLVVEMDSKVIGYLLYHFGYDSDAAARNLHIADLYVDSRMRRQGVGRAFVSAAANIAHEAGAQEMIWSVYNENKLAARFYESLGAQRITDVFFMKLRADAV